MCKRYIRHIVLAPYISYVYIVRPQSDHESVHGGIWSRETFGLSVTLKLCRITQPLFISSSGFYRAPFIPWVLYLR